MKRVIAFVLLILVVTGMLSACGSKDEKGSVYFLNFKPEQDAAWQEIAKEYTKETGVDVKIVTAAQGTYEQTLLAEIDKDEAPTLFQINGPIGLDSWRDYCLDLSDSKIYKELVSDDFALIDDGRVYGIGYVYEAYGLITNTKLLKEAGYRLSYIDSFEKLKEVAESITARKDKLGFSAFTSSGLSSSSSWRFSGHLANLPLFYEFEKNNVKGQPSEIRGEFLSGFKSVWDLYINNSTIAPGNITNAQNDAAQEFKSGKAVFYQNGTWEFENVRSIGEDNLGFIPIYFGVDDKNQGLCAGTENYWAVNADASDADINATLDFMYWMVTSDKGTDALAEKMGFVAPFKKAKRVNNELSNIADEYVNKGKASITWAFSVTPNVDVWRDRLVDALADYTVGKGKWSSVEDAFVKGWKEQYEASKQ